jgi:hypothetical protein
VPLFSERAHKENTLGVTASGLFMNHELHVGDYLSAFVVVKADDVLRRLVEQPGNSAGITRTSSGSCKPLRFSTCV